MAQDRPDAHERGHEHLETSKDALVGQFAELRHDLPLRAQRPGSFTKYVDERYPQLEQRWTAPQQGPTKRNSDEATSDMPGSWIEKQSINPELSPLPVSLRNWNDIPDEMLEQMSGETKPQSKAEAIQRRKFRKRNATNRSKTMLGSCQNFPENTPLNSMDTTLEPQLLEAHPQLQKLKLRRGIGASSSSQDHATDPDMEELTSSTPEAEEGHEQDKSESDWSNNSDIEGIEFDEILNTSRATQGLDPRLENEAKTVLMLNMINEGTTGDDFSTETEYENMKLDEAATNIATYNDLDDDEFSEYCHSYLKARKAAGEPTILPKDMLEKLRAQVKADEERSRETDPHYQHALMMAKVNAAQARREAEMPDGVLYPEVACGEKCTLEDENWDLLDDFDMKVQRDGEDASGLVTAQRSEDEMEGDVNAPSEPKKSTQSVFEENTKKLKTIYRWASKAGNVFASKKGPKDPRKVGWTLADILEEDERRARR
ncbi:hypothetical protein PSPO01_08540 [Paraphaeosphaeria sporulosa]